MSTIIEFLTRNKVARRILFIVMGGTVLFTAVALLWIRVRYAAVMPHVPQPQTGRIYRTMAAFGTAVYVSEKEHDWANFVSYDLMGVSGVFMLVLYFLVAKLRKW
ncbi:MAG: hypothetical protein WAJ96_21055 [Candidatus Acidiferrum sp.]